MEDHESEYQAPTRSIVKREIVGNKVITTVFMDGIFQEFEASFKLRAEGALLEDFKNREGENQ